jgi:hypothetical protein
VASQFHPEFKSRPERPHPLFDGFIAAALGNEPRSASATPASAKPATEESAAGTLEPAAESEVSAKG